jgi:hypothetical protein
VKAKNNLGWGSFSSAVKILAASTPDQVTNVLTSIDSSTGGVKIAWSTPSNGGSVITSYKIEIK